jgi:hypothetical protein
MVTPLDPRLSASLPLYPVGLEEDVIFVTRASDLAGREPWELSDDVTRDTVTAETIQ